MHGGEPLLVTSRSRRRTADPEPVKGACAAALAAAGPIRIRDPRIRLLTFMVSPSGGSGALSSIADLKRERCTLSVRGNEISHPAFWIGTECGHRGSPLGRWAGASPPSGPLGSPAAAENRSSVNFQTPLISSIVSTLFGAYYLGRNYRMYATPLDLTAFDDPGWSLVVFQNMTVAEALNLATLSIAVTMFGSCSALLALAWALVQGIARERLAKWFWPDAAAGGAYRAATLVNGLVSVVFLVWIARLEPAALLAGAALVAGGALVRIRAAQQPRLPQLADERRVLDLLLPPIVPLWPASHRRQSMVPRGRRRVSRPW